MALSRTVSEIWPVIGSKSQNFATPLSFRALDWGDPYGIFGKALQILKLESWGSRWWRFDDPSLHRFCLIHPCDRRTDKRTELRWLRRAIAVAAVARKNASAQWHNTTCAGCNGKCIIINKQDICSVTFTHYETLKLLQLLLAMTTDDREITENKQLNKNTEQTMTAW